MSDHSRPLLFSAPMVRALLEGRKTQTRRVLSRSNSTMDGSRANAEQWSALLLSDCATVDDGLRVWQYLHVKNGDSRWDGAINRVRCRWEIGDTFWVKEAWALTGRYDDRRPSDFRWKKPSVWYKATGKKRGRDAGRVRSSLYMPKWASRITLRVTSVRVQRVQTITDKDAVAEGVANSATFQDLWRKINGVESWLANLWVWAIGFERVKQP